MENDTHEAMKLANQVCFPLYAAARNVTGLYTPVLKPLGLTYTQYIVFLVLWEEDGLTVGEIGERLMLDNGTLSPLLKKMEQAGYVERQRSREDGRVVVITLTEAGGAMQEKATLTIHRRASRLRMSRRLKRPASISARSAAMSTILPNMTAQRLPRRGRYCECGQFPDAGLFSALPQLHRQCDTILNHTELYALKNGTWLMYLRYRWSFVERSAPPHEQLRYYRNFRGLLEKELARQADMIVPTGLIPHCPVCGKPMTMSEILERPIKRAERSAVEKTFLSILYCGMISNPPPTPDVERTGIPALLMASISR